MSIKTDNYSKEIRKLRYIYYKSGIWRKYNWYDFLKKLRDIVYKNNKTFN